MKEKEDRQKFQRRGTMYKTKIADRRSPMSEIRYPIITISREYAAGGRSVARGLEKNLGIPFYDKDFVKATAAASGYSEEDILQEGEQLSRAGRFVTNLLNPVTYQSSSDNIFYAQKQVILTLAQKPCIIIGRCANVILKDAGVDCFRVFLYADEEHRWSRAEEIAENGDADLKKYLSKRDSMRETYYKTYTGHDFGDVHDYDICLDTGKLGYERCISVLTQIMEGLAAK